MNISILGIDGNMRTVEVSKAMEEHFSIPINHANTILKQINDGIYRRWFEGKKDLECLDFGANVGLVSLYMLPACKYLYCVEPTPSHGELLRELILGNKGDVLFVLTSFALTGSDEEVVFAIGHATENKVSSEDGYGSVKIKVQGKPLSWFVGSGGIVDFCKIDIEGGEMKALTVEELKKVYGKVKVFFVEVHPAYNGGMDENREELKRRFIESGYLVEEIDYQTLVATI